MCFYMAFLFLSCNVPESWGHFVRAHTQGFWGLPGGPPGSLPRQGFAKEGTGSQCGGALGTLGVSPGTGVRLPQGQAHSLPACHGTCDRNR